MPTKTWWSIRRRLPLLLSTVLCVALVGVCIGAYVQLRRELTASAGSRALAASQQIASMMDGTLWYYRTLGGQLARAPEISGVLHHPDQQAADSLRNKFVLGDNPRTRFRDVAILDRSGRVLAHADSTGAGTGPGTLAPPPESPSQRPGGMRPGISPLFTQNGSVAYRIVDPLLSREGDTVGYAVLTRELADAGAARLKPLIGPDAELFLGNRDNSLWSDMKRGVAGPPSTLESGRAVEYDTPDSGSFMAARIRLSGAPWSVLVRIPSSRATQPARSFLITVLLIALLVFLVGALAAVYVSRQVTTPLTAFSTAAEEFAAGNYSRRVEVGRADELGSMATAFNDMAAKVQQSVNEREQHEESLEAANAELRESETRYRQLVELLPDAILVHRDTTIQFVNTAAVRLLGAHAARDLVGRSILDLVPLDEAPGASARVARLQAGQEPARRFEQTLRRLDGTPVQVESMAMRFQEDGEPAVLSIFRDITARRRLEDQLRQSQKMEAVGQLAGGVAHDFNNLLTVIITYGELLLHSRAADKELTHDLREILGAAERAARLTRQLLAFSRRQLLQPTIVDLSQLTHDLETMLRRLLPESIELTTKLSKPLGCVSADTGQIEQVILNLVVNARDAMPDGGNLEIETADVVLDDSSPALPAGSQGGQFVMLAVTDTGHGMTEQVRAKIFDPFFTTKEAGKGTGLGLSTVYGIVQQSGGSITTYSQPGTGTAFRIYLPRVADVPAPSGVRAGGRASTGSETILLVEDDTRVREAAERVLRKRGYRVITATNGVEALQVASRTTGTIDLMVTDLVMPVMGGRELAREFAAIRPDTKVLFMSGYTEESASRSNPLPPGAAFLSKPFTPDLLASKVRETLGSAGSAEATRRHADEGNPPGAAS
jgi:PAS domain S-box-containing protein